MIQEPARFKHMCNPGDLIASMAAIKSFYQQTQRKVIVSQQLNVPANYYAGATHGTRDDKGLMVCMNRDIFDKIQPLVQAQEYIHSMEVFEGQPVHTDLDVIREKNFVNLPHGMIQGWVMMAYPDLAYDLSKAWISVDDNIPENIKEQVEGKGIVNFTERYRNASINYYFLRKYQRSLVFSGTEKEYYLFCNAWGVDIPRLEVKNFLDLAYALKTAKFMLGNQSMLWNISEAMKTPRILEICKYAQNCMSFVGEKSYGFLHQEGVEHYVHLLV